MKKLALFTLVAIGFSCGRDAVDSANNDEQDGSSSVIDLMTEGNETGPGSRYAWEFMRLRDPNTGQIPANIHQREREFAATLPRTQNRGQFSWDSRGPYNVGGRTRTVAIDVLNDNIWLAGGVTGGIWRSTDAGSSWVKVTEDLQMHSVTSIVQDTRSGHESTWYAGTGEHYAIVSQTTFESRFSGDGLFKSTDNGLTWSKLSSTESNTPQTYVNNGDMDFVWRVVTDPSNTTEDVVLAAVYNGVFRSADGGQTWTEVLGLIQGGFSNPASDYVDLVVTPSGVFYATLSSEGPTTGIFRSSDGGQTWNGITPSGFPGTYGRITIAVNPLDENVVWFFGQASTGEANGHGVWRYEYLSGDGSGTGGSWDDRSAFLPDASCLIDGITTDIGKLSTQSSFDVHIGIHPTDTNVIYIGGTSIWRNEDGFQHDSTNTWIGGYQCSPIPYDSLGWSLSYPNHHPDQHILMFHPSDPNVLINANDGGLYKTVDALADSVEWVPLNNGYVTTQFYALAIEPGQATSDIVIGGLQDNGTWFTNDLEFDSTWQYIGSGDGMYCALTEGREYYLTSKQRGKLYLKQIDDQGNVLSHERIDPEDGPTTYNWANSFKMDPNNNHRIFWNGRDRLWRLDDISAIPISMDRQNKEPDYWVELDSTEADPFASIMTDIEMCLTDSGKVWYGTSNGYVYRVDNAYATPPFDHPQLVDISGDNFPNFSYVSCVSVNPFNSDQILVTFANYGIPSVFRTIDGGDTWEDISGNLEEYEDGSGVGPAVFWGEYYVDGTLFVGTSTGMYTTNYPDSTNTVWTLESDIGNVPVDHMDFRQSDGYFVVATHGRGVFSTHLTPGFLSQEEVVEVQEPDFTVYPNPATDVVNINSPKEIKQLELYDLSGKQLLNIQQFNSCIDVSRLPKGTYIVVAKGAGESWKTKLIKR